MPSVGHFSDLGNHVGDFPEDGGVGAGDFSNWTFRNEHEPKVKDGQEGGKRKKKILVPDGGGDEPAQTQTPNYQPVLTQGKQDSSTEGILDVGGKSGQPKLGCEANDSKGDPPSPTATCAGSYIEGRDREADGKYRD
jgi:hypothetical protein